MEKAAALDRIVALEAQVKSQAEQNTKLQIRVVSLSAEKPDEVEAKDTTVASLEAQDTEASDAPAEPTNTDGDGKTGNEDIEPPRFERQRSQEVMNSFTAPTTGMIDNPLATQKAKPEGVEEFDRNTISKPAGRLHAAMGGLADTSVDSTSNAGDLSPLEAEALKGAFGHHDTEVIHAFRRHQFVTSDASDETKVAQLELKLLAAWLFKKKKAMYPHCFGTPFTDNHIKSTHDRSKVMSEYTKAKTAADITVLHTTLVNKIDRTTYAHNRDDIVIITNAAIFVVTFPKIKFKYRLPLKDIEFISLSQFYDGIVVMHTAAQGKKDMGDRIYDTPHAIEFVANLVRAMRLSNEHLGKEADATSQVHVCPEIQHQITSKTSGRIIFELFATRGWP